MYARMKGNSKLVILVVIVLALVGNLIFTSLGTWLKAGVVGLWEGFNNLPGIAWAREQMQGGPTEEGASSTETDTEAINAVLEAGHALQQEEALDEALRRYREALAMDEEYPPTHVALAGLYLELGQEEDAIEELEKAAWLAPENSFVLGQLGRLYLGGDEYDKSVAILLRAKEADPENPVIRYWLGAAHFFRSYSEAQNAVLELERAAKLDPEDAEIQFRLAMAYVRRDDAEDVESAIRALERTLELDSSQTDAYYYLGQLYLRAGRPEAANKVWQQYVAEGEDPDMVRNAREFLRSLAE